MTEPMIDERAVAMMNFKRLLAYLVIAGVLMVTAALLYLASYGQLTTTLVVTVTAGVFVSIVLGGGLMAAGFFSSNSGYDDEVAEAAIPVAVPVAAVAVVAPPA